MEFKGTLNGKRFSEDIPADLLLIDWLRSKGCYSVKRGCESSNCGLCTVILNNKPILSCSLLAVRANGGVIETLEGLQKEATELGEFIADEGAEQCGFCNPGYMMNTIALLRQNPDPSDDDIRKFLAGNLCRCSGYIGQQRGIRKMIDHKKEMEKKAQEAVNA
jgi:carbon-monoxide dehydrogenase small subunit